MSPEKPSYPFTVWSGLLDPKHVKQMGNAIWAFLWCINKLEFRLLK
jgi:hypothetical protein